LLAGKQLVGLELTSADRASLVVRHFELFSCLNNSSTNDKQHREGITRQQP
jgi:hypothetical protein